MVDGFITPIFDEDRETRGSSSFGARRAHAMVSSAQ
jgi:hypothetical protein